VKSPNFKMSHLHMRGGLLKRIAIGAVVGGIGTYAFTPKLFSLYCEVGPLAAFAAYMIGDSYNRKQNNTNAVLTSPSISKRGFAVLLFGVSFALLGFSMINSEKELSNSVNNSVDDTRQSPTFKWMYLLPIAVAPVAHILISVGSKQGSYSKAKPFIVAAGMVTVGAVAQRIYLMEDAGIDSGRAIWGAK